MLFLREAMLEFTEFQQNAKMLPERLGKFGNNQNSILGILAACFPQIDNKRSFEDAETIAALANSFDTDHQDLFEFLKNCTKPPVTTLKQLEEFQKRVLIAAYVKMWSHYKTSLMNYMNKPFIEMVQKDLGVKSPVNLGQEVLETAFLAMSQYCSFVFRMREQEQYGSLNKRFGPAIQAQLHTLRESLLNDKPNVVSHGSWGWLENYWEKNPKQNVDLFKFAMESRDFFNTINASPEKQADFITIIDNNAFDCADLLELISQVPDDKVKSLLVIQLLSQADFYKQISGKSILERLNKRTIQAPSRISALVQLIELDILTDEFIGKMEAEAAVSLLFSPMHFHQFQANHIKALLNRYPKTVVLRYWLYHCSDLPNAHYVLAHFMSCANQHMSDEIKKLDAHLKEEVCKKMIYNLELFNPDHVLALTLEQEEYLILAMRLYLNGRVNEATVTYIKKSITRLMSKQHSFCLESMHLIIALNSKQEFKNFNAETHYIHHFFKYFKGNKEQLSEAISRYLLNNNTTSTAGKQQYLIYQLNAVLDRKDIDITTREAMFVSFLQHPEVYDDTIKKSLFLFDATRFIQHFGLPGGTAQYERVLDLCDWALKKLDPSQYPEIIDIVKRAQKEAKQELVFSETMGYFSKMLDYFRRCWLYGWTGFFKPKLPVYVAPASVLTQNDTKQIANHDLDLYPLSKENLVKKINFLIAKLESKFHSADANELIKRINQYYLKAIDAHEFGIRANLDKLFIKLASESHKDSSLFDWFIHNQESIMTNRIRLLELCIIKGLQVQIETIVKHSDPPFASLQQFQNEFTSTIPELHDSLPEKHPVEHSQPSPAKPSIMGTMSGYANSAWATLFATKAAPIDPVIDVDLVFLNQ